MVLNQQIERNDLKRKINEPTRERDELAAAQSGPRRNRRCAAVDPLTPIDYKYKATSQRCALVGILWITPNLYEIEVDANYSQSVRYSDAQPGIRAQVERQDMLSSISEELINGLNKEEHYRKVFGDIGQDIVKNREFRTAEADFQELLGYNPDKNKPSGRYPTLAPVLYRDNQVGNDLAAFRSFYIKDVFRAIIFGPTSVEGQPDRKPGPQVAADALSIKSATPGAIATAAIWTRWAISPDNEFRKELIIRALEREKEVLDETGEEGPYTQLMREWNSEFPPDRALQNPQAPEDDGRFDVAKAIARAEAFGRT
ncbi:hypothetical protein RhiJN_26256 [Ceratobasidium sp. AG-Ba]|nr:hypothetical protein RhiJN_26256 [Ceratobasidium sp. AG-Ba]